MNFGKAFTWGAATSSYQIEGAAYRDDGGRSVWDMLCQQDGKVLHGDSGEFACEHYRYYQQDISLMAELGLQAYRFSISWPRVLPDGTGKVNERGLDFYSQLVDELLEKGITPWVTLFHWDYPYELYCRGGWLNRDSADWFADYTALIVNKLSDRVSQWSTLNEPQCFISLGHLDGMHAPGLKMGMSEALLAAHNALRAHGKSVQSIRANAEKTPSISMAQANKVSIPVTDHPDDIEAARQHMFANEEQHLFSNSWYSDPMILGQYPEDGLDLFTANMPRIYQGDMEDINQPLDYFGTNIYSGVHVRASNNTAFEVVEKDGLPLTQMGWPITPEALYWGPRFVYERYELPIVVTENGMANDDQMDDGKVYDRERIDYLYRYLSEYQRAIQDGVPARGYFLWSLMDNFEWAEGYDKRFGIVHIDYETQERTLKYSAHWYKSLIAAHRSALSNDSDNDVKTADTFSVDYA